MKKISKIVTLLCIIIGLIIICGLFKEGYVLFGFIAVIVWALGSIIFLINKAYPYRFMFPGLLTFFLFMIIPILFTIYISFTNLGTGHLLTQKKAQEILLSEIYISDDSPTYNFQLYSQQDGKYLIHAFDDSGKENYASKFSINNHEQTITLLPVKPSTFISNPMQPGRIFKIFEKLQKFSFIIPGKRPIQIASTKYMTIIQKRYELTNDEMIKDVISGTVYWPDYIGGNYTDGKENITPGFFVNVGFSNFISLFTNKSMKGPFLKVILWTLAWSSISVLLTFCFGIFLAIFVNSKAFKGKFIYRILLIIPYSIPFFISVLIFKGLFNKDYGIINEVVNYLFNIKIDWLGTASWAKVSCLLVNLWLGFPYMFLITTGILQSIPESVYEAAAMDGAGKFITFRKITLPLVMSAVAPLLVGAFAFNLNNFVGIYLLTGGGPPMMEATTPVGETDILISYTYRLAFEGGRGQDFGMASAIALIIFIIIAILTLINFKMTGMLDDKKA